MSKRHTDVPKNGITRSFGLDDETGEDLVVELRPGEVEFRKEPTHVKRLNKNKLPKHVIKTSEIFDNIKDAEVAPEQEGEVVDILEAIANRCRIGDFQDARNPGYELKVWLLRELKHAIQEQSGS